MHEYYKIEYKMGNLCSNETSTKKNSSYYEVDLYDRYLLIFNASFSSGASLKPFSFYKVDDALIYDAVDYIKRLTFRSSLVVAEDEEKFSEIKNVTRKDLVEIYKKMPDYQEENLEYIYQIKIHYVYGDQKYMEGLGMKIDLENFIRDFIIHRKYEERKYIPREPTPNVFKLARNRELLEESLNNGIMPSFAEL